MPSTRWLRNLALTGLGGTALALGGLRLAAPAYSQNQPAAADAKYLGVGRCSNCHTAGPIGNQKDDFVLLTEFVTWRTQDRHSLAYLALLGPRGQEMGKVLNLDVTKKETGCLGCHSMDFVPEERRSARDFFYKDGVTCDGCHGPAEKWVEPHQDPDKWRVLSAAEKEKLGMNDLRDPVKRSAVCMECHVGNAEQGKVVTHAMFAAGHPPLPNFETGYFSHNLPQHWRDKKDVPFFKNPPAALQERLTQVYHLQAKGFQLAQAVLASSLGGLQAEAHLIAGRASFAAGNPALRWPELAMQRAEGAKEPAPLWPELAMAHSDCYACHHELKRPSWRQARGYLGKPGRPPVRLWPLALPGLDIAVNNDAEVKDLQKQVQSLVRACDEQPFGVPRTLAPVAEQVAKWSGQLAARNAGENATPAHAQLLRKLCAVPPQDYPDYDSARQIAAAVLTVAREWSGQAQPDAGLTKLLDGLEQDFNLKPYAGRRERLQIVLRKINEVTKEKYLADPTTVEALERMASAGSEASKGQNQDAQRDLTRFLDALRRQSPREFSEALLADPNVAKALDDLNNQELQRALRQIGEYDPLRFKQQLQALAGALPKAE